MSLAQFHDNVFEQNSTDNVQSQSNAASAAQTEANGTDAPASGSQSSFGVPGPGEQEEGPGNPGEPVPIDGFLPFLLFAGLSLIVYYEKKNKKINI